MAAARSMKSMSLIFCASLLLVISTIGSANEYDAILFRTHFIDGMILSKLNEISKERNVIQQSSSNGNVLPSINYELNVIYDEDTTPDFPNKLAQSNFDIEEHGVRLTGLKLKHFLDYPNVKPVKLSKSHYQHLAYTSWWMQNSERRNWRFIWCLEHDVAVTGGHWRSVFDKHLFPPHSSRDFISWRVGWSLRGDAVHGGGQWNIGLRYGKIGREFIKDNEVSVHFGPLIRFTSKYLNFLEMESKKGTTGHAEVVPSTLCNITQWCSMGNLSVDIMGGRDGGLFDYKLPRDITSPIYHALVELRPGYVFHPVRDVGTASDSTSISSAESKTTQSHHVHSMSNKQSLYMAMCLLRNPRPPRPSYNCPFGCPWHEQITCPTVNCMAREEGTYHHMAHQSCFSLCMSSGKCPWSTGTTELLEIAQRREGFSNILEGNFSSVAGPV